MLHDAYLTANGTDAHFPTFAGGRPSHTTLGHLGELGFINLAPAVEVATGTAKGLKTYASQLAQQAAAAKKTPTQSPWATAVETIGAGLQSVAELTTKGITSLGPAYFQLKQAEQAVKGLRYGQKTAQSQAEVQGLLQQIQAESELEAAKQQLELERLKAQQAYAEALAKSRGEGEKGETPAWLIPAAIGGVGLLVVAMFAMRK